MSYLVVHGGRAFMMRKPRIFIRYSSLVTAVTFLWVNCVVSAPISTASHNALAPESIFDKKDTSSGKIVEDIDILPARAEKILDIAREKKIDLKQIRDIVQIAKTFDDLAGRFVSIGLITQKPVSEKTKSAFVSLIQDLWFHVSRFVPAVHNDVYSPAPYDMRQGDIPGITFTAGNIRYVVHGVVQNWLFMSGMRRSFFDSFPKGFQQVYYEQCFSLGMEQAVRDKAGIEIPDEDIARRDYPRVVDGSVRKQLSDKKISFGLQFIGACYLVVLYGLFVTIAPEVQNGFVRLFIAHIGACLPLILPFWLFPEMGENLIFNLVPAIYEYVRLSVLQIGRTGIRKERLRSDIVRDLKCFFYEPELTADHIKEYRATRLPAALNIDIGRYVSGRPELHDIRSALVAREILKDLAGRPAAKTPKIVHVLADMEHADAIKLLLEHPDEIDRLLSAASAAQSSPKVPPPSLSAPDQNVVCGTVCESGHEGSYNSLDQQLKRQFDLYALVIDVDRDLAIKPLTEAEVDRALIALGYAESRTFLQTQREAIRSKAHIPRTIAIFFSLPETGTELFWVGEDYAGGHFNRERTRIHISLPLLTRSGLAAAAAVARHELSHIRGDGHRNDEGLRIVMEIAAEESSGVLPVEPAIKTLPSELAERIQIILPPRPGAPVSLFARGTPFSREKMVIEVGAGGNVIVRDRYNWAKTIAANTAPPTVFYGTSSLLLESIMKYGLDSDRRPISPEDDLLYRQFEKKYSKHRYAGSYQRDGQLSLTLRYDTALMHAQKVPECIDRMLYGLHDWLKSDGIEPQDRERMIAMKEKYEKLMKRHRPVVLVVNTKLQIEDIVAPNAIMSDQKKLRQALLAAQGKEPPLNPKDMLLYSQYMVYFGLKKDEPEKSPEDIIQAALRAENYAVHKRKIAPVDIIGVISEMPLLHKEIDSSIAKPVGEAA